MSSYEEDDDAPIEEVSVSASTISTKEPKKKTRMPLPVIKPAQKKIETTELTTDDVDEGDKVEMVQPAKKKASIDRPVVSLLKDKILTPVSADLVSQDAVEEKLLLFLAEADEPIPTLKIARALFGPSATRKTINPILYKMEKRHLIVKTCEKDGTKPHWTILA